jgi:hypothetical protein
MKQGDGVGLHFETFGTRQFIAAFCLDCGDTGAKEGKNNGVEEV